jgi:hypothetical protein
MSPAFAEAMGEAAALYKNQHIKLKKILNTLTPYW